MNKQNDKQIKEDANQVKKAEPTSERPLTQLDEQELPRVSGGGNRYNSVT
jgi:hypothetical protein